VISKIKSKIRKIMYPNTFNSEVYVNYLIKNGCSIGKGTYFFSPRNTTIDITRPHLIKIGEYCKITSGVTVLAHDYSRSVLRRVYGEIIAEADETIIGDNVFIGMNTTILMGVKIGSNVIVGTGSVVTHDIPNNVVAAGNPAKVICTLDEYYKKRKEKYITEAKWYANKIYSETGNKPTIQNMGPFFPLYLGRNKSEVEKFNDYFNLSGDSKDEIIDGFMKQKPIYNSFDDFLEDVGIK
jgi:acetyltransferase-like isoleucine patch superfamily enzyme